MDSPMAFTSRHVVLGDSMEPKLVFDGYRKPIDEYYGAISRGETADPPAQGTPARLAEIVDSLAASDSQGRSRVASFLLDAAGDYRNTIAASIDQLLADNRSLRRTRPLSTYGGNAFTLMVWSPSVPRDPALALRHTQTVAAAGGEPSRFLLELDYSSSGTLVDAHWQTVDLSALAPAELAHIQRAALEFRQQRVSAARAKGGIGRNDPCPCGSRRKYKRCCLRRSEG